MIFAVSISIYIGFAFIFTLLLCLITKYFHRKLRNEGIDSGRNEIMNDEVIWKSSVDQLSEFDEKFERENKSTSTKKSKEKYKNIFLNLDNVKQLPQESFRNTPLLNKLNNQLPQIKVEPGLLSKQSLKVIKNKQLKTTKFASDRIIPNNDRKIQNYDFLSKLIGYEQGKITIIQRNVKKLKKDQEGQIIQLKNVIKSQLNLEQEGSWQFEDYLEVFGFSKQEYGGFKYITTAATDQIIPNQTRDLKTLKTSERTQWINLQTFKKLAKQILSQ